MTSHNWFSQSLKVRSLLRQFHYLASLATGPKWLFKEEVGLNCLAFHLAEIWVMEWVVWIRSGSLLSTLVNTLGISSSGISVCKELFNIRSSGRMIGELARGCLTLSPPTHTQERLLPGKSRALPRPTGTCLNWSCRFLGFCTCSASWEHVLELCSFLL